MLSCQPPNVKKTHSNNTMEKHSPQNLRRTLPSRHQTNMLSKTHQVVRHVLRAPLSMYLCKTSCMKLTLAANKQLCLCKYMSKWQRLPNESTGCLVPIPAPQITGCASDTLLSHSTRCCHGCCCALHMHKRTECTVHGQEDMESHIIT